MRTIPVLLLIGTFSAFALPSGWTELSKAIDYLSLSLEERTTARMGGLLPIVRRIEERVPETDSIVFDLRQIVQPLYVERMLAYWLYPRKVYSAQVLRMKEHDVDEFLRSRRVGWYCDQKELRFLGLESPPVERARPPHAIHSGNPLRPATGIVIALLYFLFVGYALLLGTGAGPLLSSRTERAAAAFLLGTGAVSSWTLLCFVVGLGVSLGTVLAAAFPALIAVVWRRRAERRAFGPDAPERNSDASGARPGRADRIAAIACLVLFVLLVLRACATPMEGYDDRYQWAHKAHIMLHERSIWEGGFQDPYGVHFHPRYPLLVPAAEAVIFLFAGGFDDQYVKILFPLIWGAGLVVLFHGLERFGLRRGRWVAVLVLMLVPYYWGYQIDRDQGTAFQAYPDLPLSVFVAGAMIYFLRGLAEPRLAAISPLLILFAGLTKAEGKTHALVFVVLVATWLVTCRRSVARLVRSIAPFAASALLILLYEAVVARRTDPGILPDDYTMLLTWDRLLGAGGHAGEVLSLYAKDFFFSPRYGFLGIVLLGSVGWSLGFGRNVTKRIETGLPLVYTLVLAAAFCVPYVVLPEENWRAIYLWSSGRLLSQIVPVAFLAVSLPLMSERDVSGRERNSS